ncbi:winged helix-turn-helix domain-containing protein [Pseudoalteromonas luteoviolacea]|nr:winged helix-turn-helix domain-containing protein [Pseudoalteromonas luteoviolacea]
MMHSQQYQLGRWLVCPKTNSIKNKSETRMLDNKSMQVLLLLIQEAGKVVTKETIFEQVWAGKFVAADILSVTISKIRKALDDSARNPIFIKTIPNEGYLLIAEVKKVETPYVSSMESATQQKFVAICCVLPILFLIWYFTQPDEKAEPQSVNVHSIAVLPFEDLSPLQDSQYFAEGLSDAIINQLSQVKSLKVISRYSSFLYRDNDSATEIGKALQVDAILDGHIQKMGEQTRIHVRIIGTHDGQLLWSKIYTGQSDTSFQLQDEVSASLSGVIDNTKSTHEKQRQDIDAQAYEWYLMGQYHWRQRTPDSLNKAVTYFEHSLALEPDYADAHIGLAISYAFLHTFGSWGEMEAINAALPHIEKALALKPNSPLALATQGMLLSDKAAATGNFALYRHAQDALSLSLEIENNATTHLWYSKLLNRLGKQSEAVAHLEQAIILNPLSAPLKRAMSFLLKSMGKQNSAQLIYQQALELDPDSGTQLLDAAKVNRHTQTSILAMANWHRQTPALFDVCSSIEVCEQQVLAYLSVGAEQAARVLLNRMEPLHGHFIHSLDMIALSESKNEAQILANIRNRVFRLPYSVAARLKLARAQYRAAQFEAAKNTLLQVYPSWQHDTLGRVEVSTDNYQSIILYAATLIQLHDTKRGLQLLRKVDNLLGQGEVFDKVQTQFSLAEVNALQGNHQRALNHLANALEMGWVESLNSQWWTLKNNHLLQSLQPLPEFQKLLAKHLETRKKLADRIDGLL